ncbi:hypothetical protein GUJ93_ZPchr0006g43786 [Zizania palustris]|uniref:TRF2/HOY1 PH-like domain-containing protein n=1 Tax=Zizania palustris TaxID=103762 RepID=A0A8J5T6C8_ZIZPA|nr:hypothetical protein GUJ93_ZPchr0006g43786 [Zizania palustris]
MERTEILEDTHNKKDELAAEDLELELSESFLNFISLMLKQQKDEDNFNLSSKREELKTAHGWLDWKNSQIKPTRFHARILCIGKKKFTWTNECNIFAKFCYRSNSVICQMCKGSWCRKVEIPFKDITTFCLLLGQESDFLVIVAKSSLKLFKAAKPLPGMFHDWKVDDSKDDEDSFPESKSFIFLIEKGTMEKCYPKLLYTNPKLLSSIAIRKIMSCEQYKAMRFPLV